MNEDRASRAQPDYTNDIRDHSTLMLRLAREALQGVTKVTVACALYNIITRTEIRLWLVLVGIILSHGFVLIPKWSMDTVERALPSCMASRDEHICLYCNVGVVHDW